MRVEVDLNREIVIKAITTFFVLVGLVLIILIGFAGYRESKVLNFLLCEVSILNLVLYTYSFGISGKLPSFLVGLVCWGFLSSLYISRAFWPN